MSCPLIDTRVIRAKSALYVELYLLSIQTLLAR